MCAGTILLRVRSPSILRVYAMKRRSSAVWRQLQWMALLGALPWSTACDEECTRASHCAADEVCYQGVCTPALADYLTCSSDQDCTSGDPANSVLYCELGRCRVRPSAQPQADGGVPDVGPLPDAGPQPDAGPRPDAGPQPDGGMPDGGMPDGGGGVQTSTFAPDRVYLYGSVMGAKAVTDPSAPENWRVGFGLHADRTTLAIRAYDGALLYAWRDPAGEFDVKVWQPDGLIGDATANDISIATPCPAGMMLLDFTVAPDDGTILHECTDNIVVTEWLDSTGNQALPTGTDVLSMGYAGYLLVDGAQGTAVMDAQGNETPVGAVNQPVVVRPRTDGFDAVVGNELWSIDLAGNANMAGTYPALPPDTALAGTGWALDSQLRLYEVGYFVSDPQRGNVIRRSVGGASEVIFDEGNNVAMFILNNPVLFSAH